MDSKKHVIKVVVGNGFFGKHQIGPLFRYEGLLAKHFSVSAEIPSRLMDLNIQSGHFWLVMEEQVRHLSNPLRDHVRIPRLRKLFGAPVF